VDFLSHKLVRFKVLPSEVCIKHKGSLPVCELIIPGDVGLPIGIGGGGGSCCVFVPPGNLVGGGAGVRMGGGESWAGLGT
jgi:hypothetical protein